MGKHKQLLPCLSPSCQQKIVQTLTPLHTSPGISPFLRNLFGRSKGSFNASWFDEWAWLHWDEASQRAFCFTCVSAFKHKLRSATADAAYITKGYQNWKDATLSFRNHESSACHKEAVKKMVTMPATHCDVGECLSTALAIQ